MELKSEERWSWWEQVVNEERNDSQKSYIEQEPCHEEQHQASELCVREKEIQPCDHVQSSVPVYAYSNEELRAENDEIVYEDQAPYLNTCFEAVIQGQRTQAIELLQLYKRMQFLESNQGACYYKSEAQISNLEQRIRQLEAACEQLKVREVEMVILKQRVRFLDGEQDKCHRLRQTEVPRLKQRLQRLEEARGESKRQVDQLRYQVIQKNKETLKMKVQQLQLRIQNDKLGEKLEDMVSKLQVTDDECKESAACELPSDEPTPCIGCSTSESGGEHWGVLICHMGTCTCCRDVQGEYCERCYCLSDVNSKRCSLDSQHPVEPHKSDE